MDTIQDTNNIEETPTTDSVTVEALTDEELDKVITGENRTETEDTEPSEQVENPTIEETPQAKEVEASEGTPDSKESVTVTQEKWEAIQKQLAHQRSFIGKRSQEIGTLRKQLEEREQQLKELIRTRIEEDPTQALDLQDELKNVRGAKAGLDEEQQILVQRHQVQDNFFKYVHPDDVDIDGMTEALKAERFPDEFLQRFKQDPFGSGATPMELIQLSRRVKAEKVAKQLFKYAEKVTKELQALKKNPKNILNNISKNLKNPPLMSSADGGRSSSSSRTLDPSKMSDSELDDFLNSMRK